MRIVVGVTGSSGAVYALDFLKKCPGDKFLVMSKWGKVLLKDELQLTDRDLAPYIKRQFANDDLAAPIASGSNKIDAYVIIPCSTSTLANIASGIGSNLITRAAQVALKERTKMVLCIRETPLSTQSLEQMARLSSYGVTIMPISPPNYFVPITAEEYIGAFTEKVLGVLGLSQAKGWRAEELE
jgi:4-hydroxy-3-polyprenylbenzoate decarboxylase